MKHFRDKNDGFGTTELLLVLLVVVLLAVGGWFVYKNQHKTATSTTSTQEGSTQSNPAASSETSKYLTIKEWGVKIKMEDADKLTYVMSGTPNGSPNADSITSSARLKLSDLVPVSDACRSFGPSIVQTTAATNATKIGNYYYGFEGGYEDCGDSSIDALRQKIATQELVLSAIVAK